MPKTMFQKIWEAHEVRPPEREGGASLLYVDLHLVHEVTSRAGVRGPAARRAQGAPARTARSPRPTTTCPPTRASAPALDAIRDLLSRAAGRRRWSATAPSSASPTTACAAARQGIVHVIGPELGLSQPGITIACGDSHTSTHGALGALAMPVGTSEVEHVLATQCLLQARPRTMRITYTGEPGLRRHRQGPDPRHDRPDQRRRRDRPRRRVRGRADRGAVGRGPDDDLQHVDRGRRPRRHDRPRRRHLLLPRGPARRAGRLRRRGRALARAAHRRRRRRSTPR